MKKVLYVLLPQFAEHELPYLTQPLRSDAMAMKENPKYENKIVAESMEPVEAISGFRLLPDYTFDTIPNNYAALVPTGETACDPQLYMGAGKPIRVLRLEW